MIIKTNVDDIINDVCEIDYMFSDTFPVRFSVKNGDDVKTFEAGLCWMSDIETQYLVEIQNKSIRIIDIQDPDCMSGKDIGNMINTCCEIKEGSVIKLDLDESFDGSYNDDVLDFMDTDDMFEACEKYSWHNR